MIGRHVLAEKRKGKGRDKADLDLRPMKALTHPLRVKALKVLTQRTASPSELSYELEEPLGNVSYHVKTLLEYDCVKLVKTEPRRGAVEHYYRATPRGEAAAALLAEFQPPGSGG
jgi:DNA-binding transcriptional ArsR family regulator